MLFWFAILVRLFRNMKQTKNYQKTRSRLTFLSCRLVLIRSVSESSNIKPVCISFFPQYSFKFVFCPKEKQIPLKYSNTGLGNSLIFIGTMHQSWLKSVKISSENCFPALACNVQMHLRNYINDYPLSLKCGGLDGIPKVF